MSYNAAIGTCPCPVTGCGESSSVHRFRSQHLKDTGRRYAGKLYLRCPKHGRFGVDVAAPLQEWILEHATITDAAAASAPPDPEPAPPAAPTSAAPVAMPAPPSSSPAAADARPKSPPAEAPARKRGGYTFFD